MTVVELRQVNAGTASLNTGLAAGSGRVAQASWPHAFFDTYNSEGRARKLLLRRPQQHAHLEGLSGVVAGHHHRLGAVRVQRWHRVARRRRLLARQRHLCGGQSGRWQPSERYSQRSSDTLWQASVHPLKMRQLLLCATPTRLHRRHPAELHLHAHQRR